MSLHTAVLFVIYSVTIGANRTPLCAKWPSPEGVYCQLDTAGAGGRTAEHFGSAGMSRIVEGIFNGQAVMTFDDEGTWRAAYWSALL